MGESNSLEELGKTGTVKQGEYVKSVSLTEILSKGKSSVTVKVRSYLPGDYISCGALSLEIEIETIA